jgi:NAD(P)-dependent dehydrogenase (short-subunit alcohol dehydrogenase family)
MNKNYLIIGSTGIGGSLAQLLSAENRVFATYNNNLRPNTASITYHPINVLEDTWDLSFLPDTLDGLVYCVGAVPLKPFVRAKATDFTDDYQLQVVGAVKAIQACLPALKKSTRPSIVLFSTVAVQTGFNFHSVVSASKGAIEGLTRALAAELSPNIRVNCIAPSITKTPLTNALLNSDEKIEANAQRHPLKRIGSDVDIAEAAAYLLSEKSGWITGQILHVDGGMSALRS